MASSKQQLHTAMTFLKDAQLSNGSWRGRALASDDPDIYSVQGTIFTTALIANCVGSFPEYSELVSLASDYLIKHRRDNWSWNYGSVEKSRGYPDDLDDTALAVSALFLSNRQIIDGEALGCMARNLVGCEVKPGGPYSTWINPPEGEVWKDVDPVVNANTAYMLKLLGVSLDGLDKYMAEQVVNKSLSSPYYCTDIYTVYRMSFWFTGSKSEAFKALVNSAMANYASLSSLELALLITTCINLEYDDSTINRLRTRLLIYQNLDGSWDPYPLFVGQPIDGHKMLVQTYALTTAFCIQALSEAVRHPQNSSRSFSRLIILDELALLDQGRQSGLQHDYRQRLVAVDAADSRGEITDIATMFHLAAPGSIESSPLKKLNAGSAHGWLAYTLYDDLLDETQSEKITINTANAALRRSLKCYLDAIPNYSAWQEIVMQTFDRMDGANFWESAIGKKWTIGTIPAHPGLKLLADKSSGHMLSGLGVLVLKGMALKGEDYQRFVSFFDAFLIAKQLNDDCHDWEDDLKARRVSFVTTLLLRNGWATQEQLRERFWTSTIYEVASLILENIEESRANLRSISRIEQPQTMLAWLETLESSALNALSETKRVSSFIKSFSTTRPSRKTQ